MLQNDQPENALVHGSAIAESCKLAWQAPKLADLGDVDSVLNKPGAASDGVTSS